MKTRMRTTVLAALLLAGLVCGSAAAETFTIGEIAVAGLWARASPTPMMKAGAAFATITNRGSEADRLVAGSSPAAKRVELHTHVRDGDIMKMRQVEAIEVPPGTSVALKPGGLHIMLIGLKAPLREGASVPLTLTFEKAGPVTVSAAVRKGGAMGGGAPAAGVGPKPGG